MLLYLPTTHLGRLQEILTTAPAPLSRWALANPHASLHIPSDSRISKAAGKKRGGRPRRPIPSMASVLSNLHLLLRVPSFARWPLSLHFFAPEFHRAWESWCADVDEPLRESVRVFTDFGKPAPRRRPRRRSASAGSGSGSGSDGEEAAEPLTGVHALPVDYAPMKEYVAKTRSIFEFEREGACVVCGEDLPPGEGLYAVCSGSGCEAVGHLSCWSRHILGKEGEGDGAILPVCGNCPKCKGEVRWGDMMKELSLRVRGPKEVEKLLKEPQKRKRKAKADDDDGDEAEDDDE